MKNFCLFVLLCTIALPAYSLNAKTITPVEPPAATPSIDADSETVQESSIVKWTVITEAENGQTISLNQNDLLFVNLLTNREHDGDDVISYKTKGSAVLNKEQEGALNLNKPESDWFHYYLFKVVGTGSTTITFYHQGILGKNRLATFTIQSE